MPLALAQGLATNGPAGDTAVYFAGLAALVGGAMPLLILIAWLVYLGNTVIVYEWSKEVAAAHSWVAFLKRGLGEPFAFLGGWFYWYYYMTGFSGYAVLGFASFAYLLFPSIGAAFPYLWVPVTLALIGESTYLVYRGVKPSTTYVLVTGLAEVVFLVVTALILIAIAGPHNTVEPFTLAPVGGSITTLMLASVFAFTTFGGMNSVIPVAEETKDPKRNVPRALVYLSIILGAAVILNAYGQEAVYGVNNMSSYAALPDPGITVYLRYLGVIGAALFAFFVLNSYNSAAVGYANNYARLTFGMGRDGVLFTGPFAKINKYGVPGRGILLQGVLNAAAALVAGFLLGPFMGSVFLITSNGFFIFLNHMLGGVGLALHKHRTRSLRVFRHVVIPAIVFVALGAAIVYSVYPAPPAPLNYATYVAGAWILLGVLIYLILRRRHPGKMSKLGDYSL